MTAPDPPRRPPGGRRPGPQPRRDSTSPGGRPPGTPRARGGYPPPRTPLAPLVPRGPGPQVPRANTSSPPRSAVVTRDRPPARPTDPRWARPSRPARRPPARGEPNRRLGIVLLAIVFVLSLFAGRLVQLQGMESGNYRKLAVKEREQTLPLPAMRGNITGANGQVLAMTVATYQVTADPPLIPADKLQHVADALAAPLGMTSAAVLNKLQHPTSRDYVILAGKIPAQNSGQITAMNLPGIYQAASYARSYPHGSVAANLIGFTGTKKGVITGGGGLELQYNSLLAGKAGSEQVQLGDGQQIPLSGGKSTPAVNGSSLR